MSAGRVLVVFLGGGLGAGLRAVLFDSLAGWGTVTPVLLANLLGACALGAVFVLADEAGLLRATTRLFLAVGVLGGFTTFSTFGWGVDLLLAEHDFAGAALYVLASTFGGIGAVWIGLQVARRLTGIVTGVPPGRAHDTAAYMAAIETEDRGD